jgi:chaperonin GroEL
MLNLGANSTEKEIKIKESIDALLPFIDQEIDKQTRQITIPEVEKVAAVAGKSAEKGRILAEIYNEIGRDGIIYPQCNFTSDKTTYHITTGIKFKNTGLLSEHMVHDEEAIKENRKERKAVYHNPMILVTKRKLSTISDINPLLATLEAQNKKDLVIFTDDMDSGLASILIDAHKSKAINICIIKAPVVYKNSVFEDFAKCTGATIVEDASGITFKNLPISALGTCGTIEVDTETTILVGIKDIADHIADLKTKDDVESKMRLCWLTPKTAILEIGGLSETDLSYHRLKYDDAIGSSQSALQYGIVAGGGLALYNVAQKLPDTIGGKILKESILYPFRQLCENSSITVEYRNIGDEMGYDLITGKIVNMFDAGIVDSALVIKNEVRNAVGIASTAITTPFLITKPEKTVEQLTLETMKGKGMMAF